MRRITISPAERPSEIPGLLLGVQDPDPYPTSAIGFQQPKPNCPPENDKYYTYHGDSHLMTIAPTRSGKGRSVILPNLLNTRNPVVVLDPKGENYQVAGDFRRSLGHRVVKIDPFGMYDNDEYEADSFNPLDLLHLPGMDIDIESQTLAYMFSNGNRGVKDPFWDENGSGLLSGVISAISTIVEKNGRRNLEAVFEKMLGDDIVYSLALLLDKQKEEMSRMAYREIAAFLQLSERDTRPGVLATAQSYVKPLMSERVLMSLNRTSFDLQGFIDGDPIDIFLILPADKLFSHSGLLRLWLGTLTKAIMRRTEIPDRSNIFFVDEAGQLGQFDMLKLVMTYMAGYGLQAWTFWQSLSQLRSSFDDAWETLADNCAVVQGFGLRKGSQKAGMAQLLGVPASSLVDLKRDQMVILSEEEEDVSFLKKIDYLNDEEFAGRFQENRFFRRRN